MKQLQKTIFPLILALILVLSTGMTVLATGEGNIDGGGGGMGSGTKTDVWHSQDGVRVTVVTTSGSVASTPFDLTNLCETGSLSCEFGSVEVMGRDISVVSRHGASLNPTVRSIISAENRVDAKDGTVRFSLKPQKVFLFRKETEERLYGEITE